jgi:selenophosphate synthetase-related protein
MLLECSGIGAAIEPEAVPMPAGIETGRWLLHTFPSYGFLLAVPPAHAAAVSARFAARGLACAAIGHCEAQPRLHLRHRGEEALAWNFAESGLIGCGPSMSFSPPETSPCLR